MYAVLGLIAALCIIFALQRFASTRNRPQGTFRLSFEAAVYLVSAVAIAGLGSYKAANATRFVDAIKWSQTASLVGQVSLLWLVGHLTRVRARGLIFSLTILFGIVVGMHVVSVSGLFLSYHDEVFFFSWDGGIIQPRISFYLWRLPVDLANAAVFFVIFGACWGQYHRGEHRPAIFALLLALTLFMGNLYDMFFAVSFFVAPLGMLLMMVIFLGRLDEFLRPVAIESPIVEVSPEKAVARRSVLSRRLIQSMLTQHPLIGVTMAMLLVSASRALGTEILDSAIILLSLLGMAQATMSVLYRVGSGKHVRRLAILALFIIALPQLIDVLYGMPVFHDIMLGQVQDLVHNYLRDWLWLLGLLLMLSAFYFAGLEMGEAREALMSEHDQLLAEEAERRRAELDLRISEERFRAIIERSTDIVMILGEDGRVRYVGASIKHLLGYDPATLIGKPVSELCHADDLHVIDGALKDIAAEQESVHSVEVRVRHSEGTWRVIEGISKNLLSDPVLSGIVVNARDITERKMMAKRFESVKMEAQRRIRHDLHDTVGQDLTGLLCMAGSLAKKLKKIPGDCADQAEALVDGVLHTMEDVRKAIQGIAPIETDPGGLEAALRQLAERACAQHEIHVRFDCPLPVPIHDYGVATQLFRIAQEALTNAVKHARAREILVSISSPQDKIVLAVTDDGTGMPGLERHSVGIGLHTMQSRASAIGASLSVSSPVGGGTEVMCVLAGNYRSETEIKKGGHPFAL